MVGADLSEIWMALEPGAWKIGMATAWLVVEQRAQAVFGAPISMRATSLEPRDGAVGAGLDDDVAELLLGVQPALRVDRQLQSTPCT
jgi:hypothetical protein